MITRFTLHQPVRVQGTADCESYWDNQHDRRADCIELRDQHMVGTIAQLNDVQAFVVFEGRDGHWFPLKDLESA